MDSIIGTYKVEKVFAYLGDRSALFTREEMESELDKAVKAMKIDADETAEYFEPFGNVFEFTPDGDILYWMKAPEGVSDEEIKEAVDAGEILGAKDGMMLVEKKRWEERDGKYYYDTGEYRETFGEEQSSVDELALDDDGLLIFGDGMFRLKKL